MTMPPSATHFVFGQTFHHDKNGADLATCRGNKCHAEVIPDLKRRLVCIEDAARSVASVMIPCKKTNTVHPWTFKGNIRYREQCFLTTVI